MPLKVLIVDDEPDLELLVRQRFRKQSKTANWISSLQHMAKRRSNNLTSAMCVRRCEHLKESPPEKTGPVSGS
jgi:hypothetical protein